MHPSSHVNPVLLKIQSSTIPHSLVDPWSVTVRLLGILLCWNACHWTTLVLWSTKDGFSILVHVLSFVRSTILTILKTTLVNVSLLLLSTTLQTTNVRYLHVLQVANGTLSFTNVFLWLATVLLNRYITLQQADVLLYVLRTWHTTTFRKYAIVLRLLLFT